MTKNTGFFLFEGIQPLDFVGPWDVLTTWGMMSGGMVNCFKFGETMETVSSPNGISFTPDYDIDNIPEVSVVVIAGAISIGEVVKKEELMGKLRNIVDKAESVLTICSGSFILQATGALEGKSSTTYWRAADCLRDTGVKVEGERIVQDGKFWSGGGVTSGIDLAFAFISSEAGREMAGMIQLTLEYFPSQELYAEKDQVASLPPFSPFEGIGAGDMGSPLPEYVTKNYFESE